MTKRQIPIGDPRVKNLNDTQWVFELEAMNKEDTDHYKDLSKISEMVKEQLANMLGLNVIPIEDPNTGYLRMPEPDEFVPLSLLLGNDQVLEHAKKQLDEFYTQENVKKQLGHEDVFPEVVGEAEHVQELTPEELEAFMQYEGDVEADATPAGLAAAMAWGGKQNQVMLEHLVLAKDDLNDDVTEPQQVRTIGQVRADLMQEAASRKQPGILSEEVELIEVDLVSSPISSKKSENQSKPIITIESDDG